VFFDAFRADGQSSPTPHKGELQRKALATSDVWVSMSLIFGYRWKNRAMNGLKWIDDIGCAYLINYQLASNRCTDWSDDVASIIWSLIRLFPSSGLKKICILFCACLIVKKLDKKMNSLVVGFIFTHFLIRDLH
jgi:hypothetical protein